MLTYEMINGKHGIFDGVLLVAVVGECIQPHVRDERAREYAERMIKGANILGAIATQGHDCIDADNTPTGKLCLACMVE